MHTKLLITFILSSMAISTVSGMTQYQERLYPVKQTDFAICESDNPEAAKLRERLQKLLEKMDTRNTAQLRAMSKQNEDHKPGLSNETPNNKIEDTMSRNAAPLVNPNRSMNVGNVILSLKDIKELLIEMQEVIKIWREINPSWKEAGSIVAAVFGIWYFYIKDSKKNGKQVSGEVES